MSTSSFMNHYQRTYDDGHCYYGSVVQLNRYKSKSLKLSSSRNYFTTISMMMISSGFTFSDGNNQRLVSLQKPLGLILEERDEDSKGCMVVDVIVSEECFAHRAGIKVGDVLLAVQNSDVSQCTLDEVMNRISKAPRVVNLRFLSDD